VHPKKSVHNPIPYSAIFSPTQSATKMIALDPDANSRDRETQPTKIKPNFLNQEGPKVVETGVIKPSEDQGSRSVPY